MCERAQKNFFQPLGKQIFTTADIPHCYSWFLYILCSELLYKVLPPPLRLCFFFFWRFSFTHPFSRLLVLSLSGRIIWNPLGKALISPSSFHSWTGLRKKVAWEPLFTFSHGSASQNLWIFPQLQQPPSSISPTLNTLMNKGVLKLAGVGVGALNSW